MKKFLSLLSLIIVAFGCICLTACGGDKDKAFKMNYIADMVAEINDAKSLGISKQDNQTVTTASENHFIKNSYIKANNKNAKKKNYLVKTTTSIGAGEVVTSSSKIEKVTFKKTTKTETIGPDGKEIKENEKLTQEEIPAQINKLLVTDDFTFMQFIPIIEFDGSETLRNEGTSNAYYEKYVSYYNNEGKQLSSAIQIRADEYSHDLDGSVYFDKYGYYSNELHQSFIINNDTGLIYKIENIKIEKIDGDLILADDGLVYEMSIKNDNTLSFEPLFTNDSVKVNDFFKKEIIFLSKTTKLILK